MTEDTDTVTRTRRLVRWLKDKIEKRRDERDDHDPWWVTLMLDLGRPAVAVMILIMCAPGEHYLGVMAGWTRGMAWLTPAALTAYAGISAVVATKRPKGAPGRKTAVCGAVLSILIAMGAQPLAHLYEQHLIMGYRPALTVVVSCIPAAVFGHLLHMGAAVPKIIKKLPAQKNERSRGHVSIIGVTGMPVDYELIHRSTHSPVVYLIQNGNRIKIGTTTGLTFRIENLSLRSSDLRLVLHGGLAYEQELHARFDSDRIGTTEWFNMSGQIREFITDPLGRQPDKRADSVAPPVRKPDTTVRDAIKEVIRTPDTVPDTLPDVSRTQDIGSGSLMSDVRSFLTDNPDAKNGELYAAMRAAGRTEPDNSFYVARKRHERKIGKVS